MNNQVHILAEQAAIQFALCLEDPLLEGLAKYVVKTCLGFGGISSNDETFAAILIHAAERADTRPDESFAKVAWAILTRHESI